jgi:hypothetical protein
MKCSLIASMDLDAWQDRNGFGQREGANGRFPALARNCLFGPAHEAGQRDQQKAR